MLHVLLIISSLFLFSVSAAAQSVERERECAFNDQHQQVDEQSVAGDWHITRENNTTLCSKSSHCFGLWEKTHDGEIRLVKQGQNKLLHTYKDLQLTSAFLKVTVQPKIYSKTKMNQTPDIILYIIFTSTIVTL